MGKEDRSDWCHLPGDLSPGKFDRDSQVTALVSLCGSTFLLHTWSSNHCCSTGQGHPYHIWALPHCIWAWASWLTGTRPLWWSHSSTRNSTSTSVFSTRHPTGRHSHGGASFFWFPSHLFTEKVGPLSQQFTWPSPHQEDPCLLPRSSGGVWTQPYSGQPRHNQIGSRDFRPSSEQGGQEPASPSIPSRATIGLVGGTMTGSPKSTKDLALSSSELSRSNGDDSDMDTASGDCI